MKKRVLFTGGSGLLALNWAAKIRDHSSVILGVHKRTVSFAGTETCQLHLESVDQLVRTFEVIAPDLVVHTAGLTNVAECENKPDLAQQVNVELAINVARACAKLGLSLVHISTDHLFSGEKNLVDEAHPVTPKNIYGRTKAEAEAGVLEAHDGSLVIRTNFYGWGPSYRKSFSDVIIESLRVNKELTLYQDVFYTPILIEPAVQAIHDLVDLGASGIYHIVGDDRVSKYEFGCRIAEVFDLGSNIITPGFMADQVSAVPRPFDMSLSNQKARVLLGRNLGGIAEHLTRLRQQEHNGVAREMQKL
jgi:dTDP-4-dehydrorhamnose reductase